MKQNKKRLAVMSVALSAAMMTAGCLNNPNASSGDAGAGGAATVSNGKKAGDKKVVVLGAFGGAEKASFEKSLKDFEKSSGIDVEYTGDQNFTTLVKQRVAAGDAPDIALFPQPGGLLELAQQGKIQPIDTYLDYDKLDSTLVPGLLDAARYKGRVYGSPMRMAVKSIVWYPKKGYTGKTSYPTIQAMQSDAAKIKSGGAAPWCQAWNSDQATGWVGTDWIEEMVLRMYGPDVYDQWVKHQIPFNDPRINKAFDEYKKLTIDNGMTYGGVKTMLSTKFGDAGNPSFQTPPKCMWQRQGNFVTTFFPKNIQKNIDSSVGTFYFPAYSGGYKGTPMVGGGDIAASFNGGDEDTKKVMEFLTSDKFGAQWAKDGGWLSPHKTFDAKNYPDETTRRIAKMATSASVFRFDGSDAMPKEVGSGTFWTEMVKWLNGQSTAATTNAIEKSWPKK